MNNLYKKIKTNYVIYTIIMEGTYYIQCISSNGQLKVFHFDDEISKNAFIREQEE